MPIGNRTGFNAQYQDRVRLPSQNANRDVKAGSFGSKFIFPNDSPMIHLQTMISYIAAICVRKGGVCATYLDGFQLPS